MTRGKLFHFFTYKIPFLKGCISLNEYYLPDMLYVDSWLGMFCEPRDHVSQRNKMSRMSEYQQWQKMGVMIQTKNSLITIFSHKHHL